MLCELLASRLGNHLQFKTPEGGMAVWTQFDASLSLPDVALRARKAGLAISNGLITDKASEKKWNACRLGFASVNEEEIVRAVEILEKSI